MERNGNGLGGKLTSIFILMLIVLSVSFNGKDVKAYDPTVPRWIKITKTYTDFSTAGLTNEISIYTLPAKGIIHACQIFPSTVFSGGTIASYTISVGISGNATKYGVAANVFTGATLSTINALIGIESMSGTTSIKATAISTVGLLNAASAGSVDIYLLISQLP